MAIAQEIKARRMNALNELFISFKYQFRSYIISLIFLSIFSAVLFFAALILYAIIIGHAAINLQSITASLKTVFGSVNGFFTVDFQLVWYLSVVIAAVFGGSILPKIGSRYSYFLFVQPVSRSSIVMGKYVAAFVDSVLVLAVYYALAALVSLYLFSSIPVPYFLISLGETMLIVLAVLAVIVFLGSSSDNPEAASMMSLFLLLFGFYFLILLLPLIYPTVEPWFMLNYAAESTYNGFSNGFQHIIVQNQSVQNQPTPPAVAGLSGFGVNSVYCQKYGLMITLTDELANAISISWMNFTLPNGTTVSHALFNTTFTQSVIFGAPIINSCPIINDSTYALATTIAYYPQGAGRPQISSGTVYVDKSNVISGYSYIIKDAYEPYPLESAGIAAGYIVFFLSLGLLIYGRREVK